MMETKDLPATANERLKATSRNLTQIGILIAVALHFGLFVLVRPFKAAELGSPVEEITAITLPPEVKIPPPPGQISRPATPRIASIQVSEDITISPTTFDTNPVEGLLPPALSVDQPADRPSFIPYDSPPVLMNASQVQALLLRYYPPSLKSAGIGGRIELWLYVNESGLVERSVVNVSSGSVLLDNAAARVVSEMRFSPAKNRDKVTPVWVQQLVTFTVT